VKSPKCRHCFARSQTGVPVCRVCRIDAAKDPKALTADEKKIAYRCRTLYTIGFLAIVSGFFGLFLTLPTFFLWLRGTPKNTVIPLAVVPYYAGAMILCSAALPAFGFGVRRYRTWSYGLGIALYSLFAALHLFGGNYPFLFVSSLFLYYVASPPTREILARANE
jgi:hypothetical protein